LLSSSTLRFLYSPKRGVAAEEEKVTDEKTNKEDRKTNTQIRSERGRTNTPQSKDQFSSEERR